MSTQGLKFPTPVFEEKLIEILRDRPDGATISDLANVTGFKRDTVSGYLKWMESKGSVRLIQVGQAKVYKIAVELPPRRPNNGQT